MTKPLHHHLRGENIAQLIDLVFNPKAADPGAPTENVPWYNTTDKKYRAFDGTATQTFAYLSDLTAFGRFRGAIDASAGTAITALTDVQVGDMWRVTTAGTITGLQGDPDLTIGDVVTATVAGSTTASDYFAMQANIDVPTNMLFEEIVGPTNLVAVTPATFTPSVITGSVSSYLVHDGATPAVVLNGNLETEELNGLALNLESIDAIPNVSVRFVGRT